MPPISTMPPILTKRTITSHPKSPPPLDNWISKGNVDISTQRKTCTDLLHLKKTTFYHKNE